MNLFPKVVINYFTLVIVFTIAIISVHLIPTDNLRTNIIESTETLKSEGVYPKFLNFKLFQMDNYTDAMMLNIAAIADNKKPIDAAMLNYYLQTPGKGRRIHIDTEAAAKKQYDPQYLQPYGRYWQGYLCFLRPLLTVFNYSQIRVLNYILLGLLLVLSLYLIKIQISTKAMILFGLTMVIINFPIIPLSMQFSTVFYIAFLGIITLLSSFDRIIKNNNWILFFFTLGGCTSYFDFLTAPMITLGLPLTVLILKKGDTPYATIIKSALFWALGFGLIWASKWIVSSILTDYSIFDDAMNSAAIRTSNRYKGMEMTIINIITFIFGVLIDYKLLWPAIGISVITIASYLILLKDTNSIIKNGHYILIAIMVPVWFLVLRNHSIQHGWFTWRALSVSIFAGLIFLNNTTSFQKINRIIGIKQKSRKNHE